MDNSKWTTVPETRARDLDSWEKLAITVGLDLLFDKWTKAPPLNSAVLSDLIALKLDLSTTKTVRFIR